MKTLVSEYLRSALAYFPENKDTSFVTKLKDNYNIILTWLPSVQKAEDKASELYQYFEGTKNRKVIKDCGIKSLVLKDDMGANKPYSPNHGYYVNHTVGLNDDMFQNPDSPEDFKGSTTTASRVQHTLVHEFAHGYDEVHGELSLQKSWLELSGWSKEPKKGLMQLHIPADHDTPEVWGEWYYDPSAGFSRFYSKRNPWDDFADSFTCYLVGLKEKLPKNKIDYFDKILL